MASKKKNLSEFNTAEVPSAASLKIGIVVSSWNNKITEALFDGAYQTLLSHHCKKENIFRTDVPGSFELPLGAQLCFEKNRCDAVICIGCVIRGDTPHFDYICQSVSKGIMDLNLKHGIPFVFGVLTCNTMVQAKERAGGKHGNKGVEAAVTAIRMAALTKS
jgi:6,7-dimethyl-8-ribityllumazine synthase